jgi:hypothetical protein
MASRCSKAQAEHIHKLASMAGYNPVHNPVEEQAQAEPRKHGRGCGPNALPTDHQKPPLSCPHLASTGVYCQVHEQVQGEAHGGASLGSKAHHVLRREGTWASQVP